MKDFSVDGGLTLWVTLHILDRVKIYLPKELKMKPPVIDDKSFDELMTDDHSLIISKFHNVYDQFRDYFNDPMSCLADIQQIRKKCGKTPKSMDTIFPSELTPEWDGGHAWYAYHYGGRSEAQFNIGMEAHKHGQNRFRIGLGFEFTDLQKGKPELVRETFQSFIEIISLYEAEFREFVDKNELRIQWVGEDFKTGHVAEGEEKTRDVVRWLKENGNARKWSWVFVGRFLRRHLDKKILENPDRLGEVIESVFSGFKPFWARTQQRVSGVPANSPY